KAEDGIRVVHVTGVQPCALPISHRSRHTPPLPDSTRPRTARRSRRMGPVSLPAQGESGAQPAALDLAALATHEGVVEQLLPIGRDRKSTRLNSSHVKISYAVFCL